MKNIEKDFLSKCIKRQELKQREKLDFARRNGQESTLMKILLVYKKDAGEIIYMETC